MVDPIVVYDNWSAGHFGDDPQRANSFGGENFMAVNGGRTLKIREGTSLLVNTGMGNTASIFMAPLSTAALVTVSTKGWAVWEQGSVPTDLSTFASAPATTASDWCLYKGGVLVTIWGDTTYYVSSAGVTALAGAPGGHCVSVLGDRIYVGGISGNENRIRWSDAASETSWTSTNFLDIGVNTVEQITMLKRQRDSIVVVLGNLSYTHASWFRLSGTPNVNQSLTPIAIPGPSVDPTSNKVPVEARGARIWFNLVADLSVGGGGALLGFSYYGYIDSGEPVTDYGPLPLNSTLTTAADFAAGAYKLASVLNFNAVLLSDMNFGGWPTVKQRNMLLYDGRWSSHVFTFTGGSTGSNYGVVGLDSGFVIGHGGSASTKPQAYRWDVNPRLDLAPIATDGSGTAVTATLDMPLYYDPQDRDVQVQGVVVDYRHYSSTTAMSVAVDVHGIRDATLSGAYVAGTPQAFTVSGAPGTVGQRCRAWFYGTTSGLSGAGFQVKLTGCKSIAIERVSVFGAVAGEPRSN